MKNKFIIGVAIIIGICFGLWFKLNNGGVVLRIGQEKNAIDYDLKTAIDVLVYNAEKAGGKVLGITYNGDLYPQKYNNAQTNIFVRGYRPYFDLRMNEKAKNIFYVHRTPFFYKEEMRNFDYYLTSQKNVYFDLNEKTAGYFRSGAVPHEALKPDYAFDVLYIYETINPQLLEYLNARYKVKVFSGMEFVELLDDEKLKMLAQAKLVIYYVLSQGQEMSDCDANYVPYAVYDIMSYGRPILTNYQQQLEKVFGQNVFLFNDETLNIYHILDEALQLPNYVRETRATEARQLLLEKQDKEWVQDKKFWKSVFEKK